MQLTVTATCYGQLSEGLANMYNTFHAFCVVMSGEFREGRNITMRLNLFSDSEKELFNACRMLNSLGLEDVTLRFDAAA